MKILPWEMVSVSLYGVFPFQDLKFPTMASENSLILSFDSLEKILSKYSTAFFLHVHSFIDVLKMTTDDSPFYSFIIGRASSSWSTYLQLANQPCYFLGCILFDAQPNSTIANIWVAAGPASLNTSLGISNSEFKSCLSDKFILKMWAVL